MDKPLIMVVDDDVDLANQLSRVLKSTDKYGVITAYSAKEALGYLAKNKIMLGLRGNRVRLIFLDIKMPEMDGLAFLEELRKDYGSDIGVAMLTAYEDEEKWERATSGFVISYLNKPFKNEEVIATASQFFAGQEAGMTLQTFEKHIEKMEEFKKKKEEG